MLRRAAVGVVLGCVLVGLVAVIAATPDDEEKPRLTLRPMIVYEAKPSQTIKHSVDWKNAIDKIRHGTQLTGPRLYSAETDLQPDAAEAIIFGWYDMPRAAEKAPTRTVRVSTKGGSDDFSVANATFFLSKTQRLLEGSPAEPPKGLSHFVAYRILDDASNGEGTYELKTAEGKKSYTLKRPAYICLPTQEWHHDEYFGVSDASSCWIVYEIDELPNSSSVSTLDQFGFNNLDVGAAKWLCVPSSVVSID